MAVGTHGAAINVYNLNENEKPIWLPGHREEITKLDFLSKELEKEIIDSNQLRKGLQVILIVCRIACIGHPFANPAQ